MVIFSHIRTPVKKFHVKKHAIIYDKYETPPDKVTCPRRRALTPPSPSDLFLDFNLRPPESEESALQSLIDELNRSLQPVWGEPLSNMMSRVLVVEYASQIDLGSWAALTSNLELVTESTVYRTLVDLCEPGETYTEDTARRIVEDACSRL
jgi:hypothetical protein